MISSLASTLRDKSDFVFNLKDEIEARKQLNERKMRLRDAVKELGGALSTWNLLRKAGIIRSEQPKSLAGTLRQLDKVRNNANDDRLSLLNNDVPVTLKNLRSLKEELALESQRLWQEHLDRLRPPLPNALLDVLGKQPAWVARVKQWRGLTKDYVRLRAAQQITLQLVDEAKVLDLSYTELRQAMAQLDLPEPVQVFLERTGDGRASLADLTPEVIEWLRRHELLTAFSIQLRPS